MASCTTDFLEAIGRHPLLTGQQEIMLAQQIQAWLPLRDRADLSPAEQRIAKVGRRAYNKLYTCNLRLVVSIAKRYYGKSIDSPGGFGYEDTIQEGCLGLARAVEKFDPARGYKFSTYAYWWIRQGIHRALDTQTTTIRLPTNWRSDMQKVAAFVDDYRSKRGRRPGFTAIAEATGVSVDRIKGMATVGTRVVSLDGKWSKTHDDSSLLIEVITDESSQSCEELLEVATLQLALDQLDDACRDIVTRRYGLNGGDGETLESIAKDYGVSRERIRQLVVSSTRRLGMKMQPMLEQEISA
jgi:RNA polymerase sigma factor (sigma-70 family)